MIRLFTALVLLIFIAIPASASEPSGPVFLTISGNVSNPNREATDDFDDAFFNSHDVSFEKARTFDLRALEALGMKTIRATYEDWPGTLSFEGPLLSDVLSAAGAAGKTLVVRALDGYAPGFPMADTEKFPVILALKVNGKYLSLGGRGPSWIIYPRDDYPELAEEDDSKLVWSVYHIEVR